MSVLTWLPRTVRGQLTVLDPARDLEPAPVPRAEELMSQPADLAESSCPSGPATDRPSAGRRRRWLAPSAGAAVVLAVAGVVIAVRLSAGAPPPALGHASTGSSFATAPATGSPADAASKWAGFPVTATPRPIVLLGGDVDGPASGFRDGDDKIAFNDGQVQLSLPVPAPPATRDGYPVIQAAAAIELLEPEQPNPPSPTTLQVTGVELVDHPFLTDRGTQQLPAWEFHLGGVADPVYILAVAPSARYSAGNSYGGPAATESADGRSLTVHFVAHFLSSDPCNPAYASSLHVIQTATAVVVAIAIKDDAPPPTTLAHSDNSTVVVCGLVGVAPPTGPFTPGESDTRTITLAEPLGARVVVDANGNPFEVTRG